MNFRQSIGYGLVPALSFTAIFYIYFFISELQMDLNLSYFFALSLMALLYTLLFLIFKKSFTFLAIAPYLGLRYPQFVDIVLYFIVYYLPFTYGLNYIQKDYIDSISIQVLALLPAVVLIFGYMYFKQKFAISVTFVKITPRVYIDLINYELHTLENIKNYEIIPEYINTLDIGQYLFGWIVGRRKKVKFSGDSFNHTKIEYIDFDIADDNSHFRLRAYDEKEELIWEDLIYYNEEYSYDKYNEVQIESLAYFIMDVENKKIKKNKKKNH